MTTPAAASPTAPLRRMVRVVGPLRWWVLAASLLAAVTSAAAIGLISTSGYLISRSAMVETTATLTLAIVGVRFFAVVRAVGRYLERYVGHLGTFRILTRIRVWCFHGIEPLAPAAFVDDRAGDVLTRFVDDVETLQDLSLRVVAPPIAATLATLVGAGVLWWLDPTLAVALVGFAILTGVVVPVATRRWTRAAAGVVVARQAELNGLAVESIDAVAELVANGREDLLGAQFAEHTARRRAAERRLAAARGTSAALAALLAGLAATTVLALATRIVADGRLDPVLLAVAPLAVLATFEAVAPLTGMVEHVDRTAAASARLVELVDRSPTVVERRPAAGWAELSGEGRIEFDDVTFRYLPDRPDALVGVSFTVPEGAQVAVVGPSGSGKSTLANLLLRFWEPQRGTIRVDGTDLRDVPLTTARSAVAVVAQHDHLFDTTVRDNLLLADADADDDRLRAACDAVALGPWLDALPDGLATRVGEDGERLSGGERQRLMIARALLADASVLVLDEATAHLDPATEAAVLDGVRSWRPGRTTIHIAHHAAALGSPDLVLHVDAGQLREVVDPAGEASYDRSGSVGPEPDMRRPTRGQRSEPWDAT